MSFLLQRSISFAGVRVLVIGDLMLDRFQYGAVSRISPEAPVPVVRIEKDITTLGGAGNVLANLASLGCRCDLIAIIGSDAAADEAVQMVTALGSDSNLLVRAKNRRTTIKTRFISGSQHLLRCDFEDEATLSAEAETAILERFDQALERADVIAVSDYAKGLLSDRVLKHVISRCRAENIPVIVDPKRNDFAAYAGATVIKPNRPELAAFAGKPCKSIEEARQAAELAMQQTNAAILLTLSEDGMALFRADHEMVHLHATATEVFDVSGAGDTALAVFSASLASGLPMNEAAMLANAGAGIVVRKLGTATLTLEELSGSVSAARTGRSASPICSWGQAAEQVRTWKAEGLRIGFTNGCFDIVHGGHIALLGKARGLCDKLVVGLNSDASVTRLKGPERPIHRMESRAEVLAAMSAVDLVVVFEEDTPWELIKVLRPTDLIKGADYSEDQVVGGDLVKADGGRIHLIDLVPGLSTSSAIERIRGGSPTKAIPEAARPAFDLAHSDN